MAYIYQRINDLPQLNSLDSTDKMLVARSNNTKTYYATYYTTLSTLSSAAWNSCKDKKFEISVLTNIASCGGNFNKVAAAALTYNNYLSVTQLQTSYNFLNNKMLSLSSAVNSQLASIRAEINNYKTAALSNVNSLVYTYIVTTNKNNKYDLSACGYFEQDSTVMTCSQAQLKDHPIIHKVTKDSVVIVTSYSNNFYAFVTPYANGKTKKQLHDNITSIQTSQWSCIGHTQSVNEPVYLGNCKAGTYLFFWIRANIDQTNASIKPNTISDFGNNDKIHIQEFSLY